MGANLAAGGATFRLWAPGAKQIYICGDFNAWAQDASSLLSKDAADYWAGFVPGVRDGSNYKFCVVGSGSRGYKRDPYARELTSPGTFPGTFPFPNCNCVVRSPEYPWHDQGFRAPELSDLIIYQFHVGTFYAVDSSGRDLRASRGGKFLDLLFQLQYLAALGINAIQPLPIVEFPTEFSLGYNGTDLFSPEMSYAVAPPDLGPYLAVLNALLAARGHPPVAAERLAGHAAQLKALIDVCHVYGIAVILDVVYNHAGGGFDDESIYFLDRADPRGGNNASLYFLDLGWAGGLAFALWKAPVRQFLIDNATFFTREYHVDGLRFDEVSALVSLNQTTGWSFCQDLTDTLRFVAPRNVQIAEYWPVNAQVVEERPRGGAGFDCVWHDGLRNSVRSAIAAASGGASAQVNLDAIAATLSPPGLGQAWKGVQCLENHDTVYRDHAGAARLVALADPGNARSWFARSRARVANALLLTAPGIPMLFMGQEFLEDKVWSDDPRDHPDTLIWWDGLLGGQKPMVDHLRFMQDLIRLRRKHPALRGGALNVFHAHNQNRVIAFHRWIEGSGRDVVVVASLQESTWFEYAVGFPRPGAWIEAFNSDVYDNWVNPWAVGNGGGIGADGGPLHGFPASARITIPANGVVVFTRDHGD